MNNIVPGLAEQLKKSFQHIETYLDATIDKRINQFELLIRILQEGELIFSLDICVELLWPL